jgi:hypothetical protein
MTDREIIKIVKEFTKGVLGKRGTTDMCYAVCLPLQAYLAFGGIECSLTEGEVNEYHHFWITMKDGRIIDPTADQFGFENIYLKPQPPHYKKYSAKDFDDRIKDAVRKHHKSLNQ